MIKLFTLTPLSRHKRTGEVKTQGTLQKIVRLRANSSLPQYLGWKEGFTEPSAVSQLPRALAESLTRATQPGLVSLGGSVQAQRYHPSPIPVKVFAI
jgi:hypothetical protein